MSAQHRPLLPLAPHRLGHAFMMIEAALAAAEGFDNFERMALRHALDLLQMQDVPAAVAVLADAIRHAYRPDMVEDRMVEITACCCAFALLTVGDDEAQAQGGAA